MNNSLFEYKCPALARDDAVKLTDESATLHCSGFDVIEVDRLRGCLLRRLEPTMADNYTAARADAGRSERN